MRTGGDMSMRRGLWATILILGFAVLINGCVSGEEIPPLERSAQEINKVVMCPVCPGESIDQSQHPLAVQMRAIVAEKLEEGSTAGQIKAYFVERYGPSVLLEPPREGLNLLVWLVPPAGLAAVAVLLYLTLRLMLRSKPVDREGAVAALRLSEEERTRYARLIEASLLTDDGSVPTAEAGSQPTGLEAEGGP